MTEEAFNMRSLSLMIYLQRVGGVGGIHEWPGLQQDQHKLKSRLPITKHNNPFLSS